MGANIHLAGPETAKMQINENFEPWDSCAHHIFACNGQNLALETGMSQHPGYSLLNATLIVVYCRPWRAKNCQILQFGPHFQLWRAPVSTPFDDQESYREGRNGNQSTRHTVKWRDELTVVSDNVVRS